MTTHDTVLWLIRHPEPDSSAHGLWYGSLDVPLSSAGLAEAESIARTLVNEQLAAIFTSPRTRCLDAARILAARASTPLEPIDAIRELDFGAFEGRPYEEIASLFPDLYRQWMEAPTETHFPAGESFSAMSARVLVAVRCLLARHRGESIALVTHAGPIRAILADALAMPPANIFSIGQRYGAINRLRYSGDTVVVELMNSSPIQHETGLK